MNGGDGLIRGLQWLRSTPRLGEAVADDGKQQAERHDGKRGAKDHGSVSEKT